MDTLLNYTASIFIDSNNINAFFSTLANTSTIFILVIVSTSIFNISQINKNIIEKKNNINKFQNIINSLSEENEKLNFNIEKFKLDDNLNAYSKTSKKIIKNNSMIYQNKLLLNEIIFSLDKDNHFKKYVSDSFKNIYLIGFLYIILPLSLLSIPESNNVLIILNIVKIILILSLIFVFKIFVSKCREYLTPNYDNLNILKDNEN